MEYILRSSLCPDIVLPPGQEVVLGRGPLTKVKDSRVSRQQMVLVATEEKVIVRQKGYNHSIVGGAPLRAGQERVLPPGDSLYLLEGQHQFKLMVVKNSDSDRVSDSVGDRSRVSEKVENKNTETVEKKLSKSSHWSQGLLSSMTDPELVIHSNDHSVTIRDKYPKAKHHYLVLPKKQVANLHSITKEDIDLFKMLNREAARLIAIHPESKFQVGYHAVPSMAQLHLHVISTDFDSPCLKHKKHWNSFTTPYFIPSTQVLSQMKEKGKIDKPDRDITKQWMDTPLKCHKCEYMPKNMPDLKHHIKNH